MTRHEYRAMRARIDGRIAAIAAEDALRRAREEFPRFTPEEERAAREHLRRVMAEMDGLPR